jgi:hypothetical protein
VAFGFAAFLVRDLALTDDVALDWLSRWDAGNRPPKGRDRLVEIIQSAHAYGQRPVGCGIDRELERVGPRVSVTPTRRAGHYIIRGHLEIA